MKPFVRPAVLATALAVGDVWLFGLPGESLAALARLPAPLGAEALMRTGGWRGSAPA